MNLLPAYYVIQCVPLDNFELKKTKLKKNGRQYVSYKTFLGQPAFAIIHTIFGSAPNFSKKQKSFSVPVFLQNFAPIFPLEHFNFNV